MRVSTEALISPETTIAVPQETRVGFDDALEARFALAGVSSAIQRGETQLNGTKTFIYLPGAFDYRPRPREDFHVLQDRVSRRLSAFLVPSSAVGLDPMLDTDDSRLLYSVLDWVTELPRHSRDEDEELDRSEFAGVFAGAKLILPRMTSAELHVRSAIKQEILDRQTPVRTALKRPFKKKQAAKLETSTSLRGTVLRASVSSFDLE